MTNTNDSAGALNSSAAVERSPGLEQVVNEPRLVEMEDKGREKERRWENCLQFLRNNPKLLMQMIPNPTEGDSSVDALLAQKPL